MNSYAVFSGRPIWIPAFAGMTGLVRIIAQRDSLGATAAVQVAFALNYHSAVENSTSH